MKDQVIWCDRGWQPVAIGFCPSETAWRREMKRLNSLAPWPEVPNAGGHTQWMTNDTTGQAVILVTVHPAAEADPMECLLVIVHEAVHVWQFLCQHIGEKSPGIEMEAYAIENITRSLIEAYASTRRKKQAWFSPVESGKF